MSEKKDSPKPKRAKRGKYEKPFVIDADFAQVIKIAVTPKKKDKE